MQTEESDKTWNFDTNTLNLDTLASQYHAKLQQVVEIHTLIKDIHPGLYTMFPIALVENNQFYIFDISPSQQRYIPILQIPTPMPIPAGVRAAFPLECYNNRPACVVTGEVFDTLEGYVTIFHEFIHCYQWQMCESDLKQTLEVARVAQAENNFMWELNYPFPYSASGFIEGYTLFLDALTVNTPDAVSEYRASAKAVLQKCDYEYMIWQEWKEGFARFIENQIRNQLQLEENHNGKHLPFDRVVFYEGGAEFIRFLDQRQPDLVQNIKNLFHQMMAF
ncbi:MAG: hypothetical protein JXA33_13615 [Anaerolineae bacterium]|nr:hypothetical protein [Anaerolineae bacterium]